jgi:hypothetical protein
MCTLAETGIKIIQNHTYTSMNHAHRVTFGQAVYKLNVQELDSFTLISPMHLHKFHVSNAFARELTTTSQLLKTCICQNNFVGQKTFGT